MLKAKGSKLRPGDISVNMEQWETSSLVGIFIPYFDHVAFEEPLRGEAKTSGGRCQVSILLYEMAPEEKSGTGGSASMLRVPETRTVQGEHVRRETQEEGLHTLKRTSPLSRDEGARKGYK